MKALITGITGQDGSYLAELLLEKGYEVHGTKRRSSSFNTSRIDHLMDRIYLHYADMSDSMNLDRLMQAVRPDEIYNLAAQSHVAVSFDLPDYTADVTASGTLRLLEAMRWHAPKARFYQASSSEQFGNEPGPQSEETRFAPRSPYACAKVFAHHAAVMYREAYGLHVSCGVLFNHESPRRGETFVTRKITMAVARIRAGLQERLVLGNYDAVRDWGYAPEYVEAMWLMLQQGTPRDYVIGTGFSWSVGAFLNCALRYTGVCGLVAGFDDRYTRPAEVNWLRADPSLAESVLGWKAEVKGARLVEMMVDADTEALKCRCGK